MGGELHGQASSRGTHNYPSPNAARSRAHSAANLCPKAPRPRRAGYPDDAYFDLLHVVTPAFNRAVIYSARQLHNAYIDDRAVGQLSCSPKQASK